MTTRKERGRRTEHAIAQHFQALYPHCVATSPGASGPDLINTPGIAVEVKARRALDLPAWLRQAQHNAPGATLPLLIIRPHGMGEASVEQWACVLTLDHLTVLLTKAGYGTRRITTLNPL